MRGLLILGMTVTALAQVSPVIRVDVNLVRVAVSVTDKSGGPVQDMRQDELTLLDNGKARPIQYMWREADLPLTVGLMVDISGSQLRFVGEHQQTMSRFLKQVLRPQDQAFLAGVDGKVRLITDLTNSPVKLQAGIDNLRKPLAGIELGEPCFLPNGPGLLPISIPRFRCGGGSVLWHGVYTVAKLKMKPVEGRKAIVFVTDGVDSDSGHSLTDAIEAAQNTDTLVYTVRYANTSRITAELSRRALNRLSDETGGRAYAAPKGGPAKIFAEIEEELRNLYVLGFVVPEGSSDGKVHTLRVKSKRKGVTLRARKSYSANP